MQSNEDILLIQNSELNDILYAPTHPSIVEPTDIKPFWNFINIARPKVSTTKNEKIDVQSFHGKMVVIDRHDKSSLSFRNNLIGENIKTSPQCQNALVVIFCKILNKVNKTVSESHDVNGYNLTVHSGDNGSNQSFIEVEYFEEDYAKFPSLDDLAKHYIDIKFQNVSDAKKEGIENPEKFIFDFFNFHLRNNPNGDIPFINHAIEIIKSCSFLDSEELDLFYQWVEQAIIDRRVNRNEINIPTPAPKEIKQEKWKAGRPESKKVADRNQKIYKEYLRLTETRSDVEAKPILLTTFKETYFNKKYETNRRNLDKILQKMKGQ